MTSLPSLKEDDDQQQQYYLKKYDDVFDNVENESSILDSNVEANILPENEPVQEESQRGTPNSKECVPGIIIGSCKHDILVTILCIRMYIRSIIKYSSTYH